MKTKTQDGSEHQKERQIDESEVNMVRIGRVIRRMGGQVRRWRRRRRGEMCGLILD